MLPKVISCWRSSMRLAVQGDVIGIDLGQLWGGELVMASQPTWRIIPGLGYVVRPTDMEHVWVLGNPELNLYLTLASWARGRSNKYYTARYNWPAAKVRQSSNTDAEGGLCFAPRKTGRDHCILLPPHVFTLWCFLWKKKENTKP